MPKMSYFFFGSLCLLSLFFSQNAYADDSQDEEVKPYTPYSAPFYVEPVYDRLINNNNAEGSQTTSSTANNTPTRTETPSADTRISNNTPTTSTRIETPDTRISSPPSNTSTRVETLGTRISAPSTGSAPVNNKRPSVGNVGESPAEKLLEREQFTKAQMGDKRINVKDNDLANLVDPKSSKTNSEKGLTPKSSDKYQTTKADLSGQEVRRQKPAIQDTDLAESTKKAKKYKADQIEYVKQSNELTKITKPQVEVDTRTLTTKFSDGFKTGLTVTNVIGDVGDVADKIATQAGKAADEGRDFDAYDDGAAVGGEIVKDLSGYNTFTSANNATKSTLINSKMEIVERQTKIRQLEDKKQKDVLGIGPALSEDETAELNRLKKREGNWVFGDNIATDAAAVLEGGFNSFADRVEKRQEKNKTKDVSASQDLYDMAAEAANVANETFNPFNKGGEAYATSTTLDERRNAGDQKNLHTDRYINKANALSNEIRNQETEYSNIMENKDLTDPKVQKELEALRAEMDKNSEQLIKTINTAEGSTNVNKDKIAALHGLKNSLPDTDAFKDWADQQAAEQKKATDSATENPEDDSEVAEKSEDGDELVDHSFEDLKNAENEHQDSVSDYTTNMELPIYDNWPFDSESSQMTLPGQIEAERNNAAQFLNNYNDLENSAQNSLAQYNLQQSSNQHQSAESQKDIERKNSTLFVDAIMGGFTSGIGSAVGAFGERVGQGGGIKLGQKIYGDDKHSSDHNDNPKPSNQTANISNTNNHTSSNVPPKPAGSTHTSSNVPPKPAGSNHTSSNVPPKPAGSNHTSSSPPPRPVVSNTNNSSGIMVQTADGTTTPFVPDKPVRGPTKKKPQIKIDSKFGDALQQGAW